MTLTLEKAVELHRKLWTKISENPEKAYEYLKGYRGENIIDVFNSYKSFLVEEITGDSTLILRDNCFLCEYTYKNKPFGTCWSKCPLQANDVLLFPGCLNGNYTIFLKALNNHDIEKAKKTAYRIANLPVIDK